MAKSYCLLRQCLQCAMILKVFELESFLCQLHWHYQNSLLVLLLKTLVLT